MRGFALVLAIFEIVSSVLLIGAFILAIRKLRQPAHGDAPHAHHGSIDWIDVFTAAVLFAEVGEHYHLTHHVKRPALLLAFTMLGIGFYHGAIRRRMEKRFTLRVEDQGLYVGGKPFGAMRATWPDVASIDVGERYGTITLKSGRKRRLDLGDVEGPDAVRAALAAAQQRLAATDAHG